MNEATIHDRPSDAVMATIGHTLAAVMRMVAWSDVTDQARDESAPLPPPVANLFTGGPPTVPEARIRITGQKVGGGDYLTWLTIEHLDAITATKLECVNPTGAARPPIEFALPTPSPGLWVHTNDGEPGFSAPSYNGTAPSFLARNMFGHLMDWFGKGLLQLDSIEILVQLKVGGAPINLTADSRLGGWGNVRLQPEAVTD